MGLDMAAETLALTKERRQVALRGMKRGIDWRGFPLTYPVNSKRARLDVFGMSRDERVVGVGHVLNAAHVHA
jgi:hypothetical protein